LLVLTGCRGAAIDQPLLPAPAQRTEPVHVVIYEWRSHSPGAGVLRTSLWACEVDLERSRWRSVAVAARRPGPMIAEPGGPAPGLLLEQAWRPMGEDEVGTLRAAIDAWLATSPPPVCEFHCPGGREDGYLMRFCLRTDNATYWVRANPGRSRQEVEICLPDPTFRTIVGVLTPRFLPN
jgi:hypothetical protein